MIAPVRLDLHVHSDRSPDSSLDLGTIVGRIRALGLQGFALTDHNSVAGHPALLDMARAHPDLLFVPGVEVSTIEGHLLGYGVDEAPPPRRPLAETVLWIRERGGEPVLAHPFRWSHGVGEKAAREADVRAVEGLNGQTSQRANRSALEIARQRGLAVIGGSDGHTVRGLGTAYTTLQDRPATVADVLEAIRRGRVGVGGTSLGLGGRLRWTVRNTVLRAGRGFRSV